MLRKDQVYVIQDGGGRWWGGAFWTIFASRKYYSLEELPKVLDGPEELFVNSTEPLDAGYALPNDCDVVARVKLGNNQ